MRDSSEDKQPLGSDDGEGGWDGRNAGKGECEILLRFLPSLDHLFFSLFCLLSSDCVSLKSHHGWVTGVRWCPSSSHPNLFVSCSHTIAQSSCGMCVLDRFHCPR